MHEKKKKKKETLAVVVSTRVKSDGSEKRSNRLQTCPGTSATSAPTLPSIMTVAASARSLEVPGEMSP